MNVIVIIADSLRQDHLGCYGNAAIRTPELDRFANESLVFEHSYSDNLPTIQTRTSWWTGQYGFTNRHWEPLRADDVLIQEVLWDQSVRTGLMTDVYHMHKPSMGFGRGFEDARFIRGQEYDPFILEGDVDVAASPHHHIPDGRDDADNWRRAYEQYLRNQSRIRDEDDTYVAQTVDAAMKWLDNRSRDERFYLWIDCFDPHEPWDPPEPYRSMYRDPAYTGRELIDPIPGLVGDVISPAELERTKQLYAGEVSLVDAWIGRLLDHLRNTGIYDDTLVVFTSDHGEPFGEHGIVRKCRPWLHEELLRVPMIVHLPRSERAGERSSAMMHAPDLMPTVLEAFDVPAPDAVQGRSWWPLLRGETDTHHSHAVVGTRGADGLAEWTIRDEHWSLLIPVGNEARGRRLYDRSVDLYEQRNVIEEHPERAAQLEAELESFAARVAS